MLRPFPTDVARGPDPPAGLVGSKLSDLGASMGDVVTFRSGSAFVGRESELAQLTRLLDGAVTEGAAGVLVGGDAGVGKTRLVTEFMAHAQERGVTAAVGRCVDLGAGGLPYLPFVESLGSVASTDGPVGEALRSVARDRPALWRLVGQEAGPAGADDAVQRLGLYEAVAVAMRSAAQAAAPFVLVLEDLHWADASTRDLLRFLLARLSDEPLMIVGTYRADDLHRRHPLRALLAELVRLPRVDRLDLLPFDADELRRYLFELQGGTVDDRVVRDIGHRSEGNAFYAAELLVAARDEGASGLPGGLADVLLTRIERLPEPVQEVARVAAVAGRRVPDALLRRALAHGDGAMAGLGLVDAALRDAVAHQVLVPDGADRFAFRHALLQEAVYGDLLPGERARLHGVYAELLAADPDAATAADLARHSSESHDFAGALAAWVRAAREAARRLAPAEALAHYDQALQLLPAVPVERRPDGVDGARLALDASHAASASGEFRRAVSLARAAASAGAEAGDRVFEAEARRHLAWYLYGNDQDDLAMAEVQRVYALLDGLGPQPERVWAATVEARLVGGRGDLLDARREHLMQTRELVEKALVEARDLGMLAAEANLLIALAASDALITGAEAAAERLAEARQRGSEADDPEVALRVADHLGLNALDVGDLDAARRIFTEGLAGADRSGLASSGAGIECRLMLAQVLTVQGDWDAAIRTVTTERPRLPVSEALFLGISVLPVYTARDPESLLARVAEIESSGPDYPVFWSLIHAPLADAFTWLGRYQDAVRAVLQTLHHLRDIGRPLAMGGIQMCALGLAALADAAGAGVAPDDSHEQGRTFLEHARRVAATGATRMKQMGPEGQAWLLRAEAEATRLTGRLTGTAEGGDPAAWRAARDAFGYGHAYESARTTWRLAEALVASASGAARQPVTGRAIRQEAAALAREARQTAVRLGARPLREAIDAFALRHRLDLGGGEAGARVLTPREEEVIRLVADGLTNREIGARLYISEKTASVHVSNLLAKLGASGRAEAVAVAHRRGLLGP